MSGITKESSNLVTYYIFISDFRKNRIIYGEKKWPVTVYLLKLTTKGKITIQEENRLNLRGEVMSVEWDLTVRIAGLCI